jgi:uracil-DNA glycosylase family 4
MLDGPRTFIRPIGRQDSKFAIFGEQPGREEVKRRQLFCGPAGNELDRCLDLADIPRVFCYISNILKDFDESPDEYIQLYQNNKLLRNPIIHPKGKYYLELLKREVSDIKADCIMAFGGIALFALTGRTGITNYRGSILPCEIDGVSFDKKIVPAFHPATVIKPKNQFLNRKLIVHDMERMRNIVEGLYIPTERSVFIKPSFSQALDFLIYCYNEGMKGERISYDIEVFMGRAHKQVSCISFAVNGQGMSIPFADHRGDYYTIDDELKLWLWIANILQSPDIRKCGQNLVFDAHFLLRRYGISMTNADDTMIAQKTIMPDYPVGLDFLTSWWTDQPYYKRDGKDFLTYGGAYETFWHYNCLDSLMCDEIFPKQEEMIRNQNNQEAYERQRLMIEPCCYMMERGLLVDVNKMDKKARDIQDEIDKTTRDLLDIIGPEYNEKFAGSSVQMLKYFKDEKKFTPYKTHRGGGRCSPTFDDIAMKRMARKGFRDEATLILKKRRLTKQHSTYLDVKKIDSDNRYRCLYKPSGTRYSRLSSAENIFGTGGNNQNWPAELQEFLLADEGYAYGAFDLDQAENRIVAYVGEILNMIEVFETGTDVHEKTALFIVETFYPQQVDPFDDKYIEDFLKHFNVKELAPMGDGTHTWRDWGKKANHGFNYDWGSDAFALKNEIPNADGKKIYNAYHTLYPGVKRGFHAYVRRCLRINRTLVNLLGRRTVFLNRLDDNTFKEAFSCIPQGSVGDIINERGIEYIYYNQDLFRSIEILRQVHDEIGFQNPLEIGWLAWAKQLNLIKASLEIPLVTHYGREFVVPASFTLGKCMNKRVGFDIESKDWPEEEDKLAKVLELGWEWLRTEFNTKEDKKKAHKEIMSYGK